MALAVDASGLLTAVLTGTPESGRLRRRLTSEVCHAPHLIDAEIGHALRRQVRRGELPEPTGFELLEWVGALIDHRHEMSGALAVGAWRLRDRLGRCHLAYGGALRRAGERGAARAQLDEARAVLVAGGALAFARLVDGSLAGLGLHLQPSSAPALTPAEEAVARLVAQRLGNPEIATRLVVSRRTVEYHLTHVYAKLGVRGRAELARLSERSATGS